MSIFFKLHITDDDPRLTDCATLGAHGVGPGAVALDLVGATVLALHGRHIAIPGSIPQKFMSLPPRGITGQIRSSFCLSETIILS